MAKAKEDADVLDEKYLKGLTFQTSEKRTVREENKLVERFYPKELPLAPEHVLDVKDVGDALIIVAADGRKHRVAKKAEKAEKG